MDTVLIVIHLMVVIALVGLVLLQRSEGGALGIGGGGGGGFMSVRGAANTLTRATAILAAIFFMTSLGLGMMARYGAKETDIIDRIKVDQSSGKAGGKGGGILDQLPASAGDASKSGGASTPPKATTAPSGDGVPTGAGDDAAAPAAKTPEASAPAATEPAAKTPEASAPSTTEPAAKAPETKSPPAKEGEAEKPAAN